MTILTLLVGPNRTTLIESGEGYEQIRHFTSVEELDQYLGKLGLLRWQLDDLRAGRTVGMPADWSWPYRGGHGPTAPTHR